MTTIHDIAARLRSAGCVFAEDEAALLRDEASGDDGRLETMIAERIDGVPLEHVVGWAEFCGMRIEVDRNVFVPRPRTELLAELALERLASTGGAFVDLCCGSGAIAAVVAERSVDVAVHAADIDAVAVACARRNVEPRGGRVHQGDLFEALPEQLRGRIDMLAANVPYVPSADVELLPRDARDHEPRATLDGGDDGLDVLRRVATGASTWLAPGGTVASETSLPQAPAALNVFLSAGLEGRIDADEDLDVAIVSARAPGGSGGRDSQRTIERTFTVSSEQTGGSGQPAHRAWRAGCCEHVHRGHDRC
jgi:release factor glutamine methyltransferase